MTMPATPEGFATVNPFVITKNADGLIAFLAEVFGGTENQLARTVDVDGLLLHAELRIGNTTVMFGERKPGWPFLPSLLQVYVDEVPATLATARRLGAKVVTEPTDFYGTSFSRFVDPWKNLWWVYQHADAVDWEDDGSASWATDAGGQDAGWSQTTPGLEYIHRTLLETLPTLRE
ncbi:VOC family protein [Micromonospora zhanjiangensis]|uniref:VOC family protein n=1 Tax=Micromonospora zhanjiangensis TaxID=1522057 RepID=A0ABV8KQB9_9ACTN